MFIKAVLLTILFDIVLSDFTFRNVIVTCDIENLSNDELPFSTIVTTSRLQPHLPNQKCDKITMQYATVPVLHKESLSDITNVNYLLLENNNIEEIESGALKNVEVKEVLSLKSNKLREIRRGVFNDVKVPILFLSYNSITYVDYQAFDNMTLLESIHLDHNKLTKINTFWFKNTPNLNKVNLQHNLIQKVPANAFQNLRNFRIDLSHNLIRIVDPDAFAKIKKLHFLSLAFNRLDSLDGNWLKGVKVDVLDISNNRFRCLTGGLAEPYSTNLIDKNPWSCECLEGIKKKEFAVFGSVVAYEEFRRCNIP